MSGPHHTLINLIRRKLAEASDPAKATRMRAYMKSDMPYRGVPRPLQRSIFRAVFNEYPLRESTIWRATVLSLWWEAEYREERYAALALTGYRRYTEFHTPALIPLYEELVVSGAWWDYVDEIAIRRLGPLLRTFPRDIAPVVQRWSTDPDMWKRRSSVVCQIRARANTDVALLYQCIEANRSEPQFFIRKAIGWALRDYAKTDPAEVRRYVAAHPELSALSKREALKNINSGMAKSM